MTDAEHANAVREATEALNRAADAATLAGLRVEIDATAGPDVRTVPSGNLTRLAPRVTALVFRAL